MDNYLGQVTLFAGKKIPAAWLECDGSLLQIKDHPELFNIIGIANGGDGVSNFALPEIKAPMHTMHYIICVNGFIPSDVVTN